MSDPNGTAREHEAAVPPGVAESLSGKYRLKREIGRGGMATVYLADDLKHSRRVAVKLLQPEMEAAIGQERFRREIEVAARLTHPHILPVHDSGIASGHLYYVMPFISGESLRARLNRERRLPLGETLRLVSEVAGALAYAHDQGIVHRDVKPENILLADGIALVADFGIARAVAIGDLDEAPTIESLTRSGMIVGTPRYMAPEQALGGTVDGRADIYALACVLYEMLAGDPPFRASTLDGLLHQQLTADAPRLDEIRRDVPPPVARAVAKALAKAPEDRFATAREFARALGLSQLERSGALEKLPGRRSGLVVRSALILSVIAVLGLGWSLYRQSRLRWARDTAITEIERLTASRDLVGAYGVAQQALAIVPDDSRVQQAWANLTIEAAEISSEPPGAEVFIRNYSGADAPWLRLGTTPMNHLRIPSGTLRFRLVKPGFETLSVAQEPFQLDFRLVPDSGSLPGMVFVPGSSFELESTGETVELPDYWLGRYEVTNREYKTFVDAGGYRRPEFWKVPFEKEGRALTWELALANFVDSTGRPGPATWELGSYPEGEAEFPVSGVSWYEAAAYAAFAGKELPTAYHWYRASGAFGVFSEILEASNFSGKGPLSVGAAGGLGPYGTLDMAGNVKEWCWNRTAGGRRYILGGGWDEAPYLFRDEDAQPPFDRRRAFGFRLMSPKEPIAPRLAAEIGTLQRDPASLEPVSDELFQAYRRLYDYDPTPLDPELSSTNDSNEAWREEQVSVRAAYGDERLPIRLFLPKSGTSPLQAIVYFPGSDAVMTSSSQHLSLRLADFLVKSGRILVYPIYQGTYERRITGGRGPNVLRDLLIQRGKDLRRSLDYLETRPDVDRSRVAFYGLSLGAQLGPLFLAIEPRFRTGVFLAGGFETWDMPPESDPVNFAPHVRTPVLMVNGREDFDLPYATAQLPMFRMLGTPAAQKRHAVLEGGHIPLHPNEAIRVVLDWLDEQLGPARP
jgi:serine/threonine protein kinase/formylglycine-generating enzyme required for sulfatase activity/dienelactone hydrolase